MYNLPNMLTISRIVVIPVIFLSIYIHGAWWSFIAAWLFIIASITDYFDGYLARTRNQTSAFGRLLDPIADKLLVVSALMIIVANDMVWKISYVPVVIILCREVLVSGLREFLAEVKVGMPVTRLAKWKTGFQMTALSLILIAPAKFFNNWESFFGGLGEILLWVAGGLTFVTGYQYFQKSLDYIKACEKASKKDEKKLKTNKNVVEKKAVTKKVNSKKVTSTKKQKKNS